MALFLMAHFLMIPDWFIDFSIGMDFLYAIVCGIVAYSAFKVYNLAGEKGIRMFGMGFSSIAFSCILRAILEYLVFKESGSGEVNLVNLSLYTIWGIYFYMALFIVGLVTIAYATFGIRSRRVYSLLLVTNLLVFYFCSDKSLIFYVLSSLLLLYIAAHYVLEYWKHKNWKTAMVLAAFVLLFLTFALLSVGDSYSDFVIASFVELCAYLLILASLLCTLRKKKK